MITLYNAQTQDSKHSPFVNLLAAQTISFDPPLHTRDWFSYIVLVNLKNRKPSGLSLCPYSFYLFAFYLLNSIIYLPTSTRETPSTWKTHSKIGYGYAREEIHVSNFEPEEFYWRDLTQASSNKIEVNPNIIAVQLEELNLKYFTRDLNPSEVLKKLAFRTQ